jgi:copper chaperone NosL
MTTTRLRLARRTTLALLLAGALAGLGACQKQEQTSSVQPTEMTRATTCSLDGMTLMDFPGPKGQIHYAHGETDFFCDTFELFSIVLRPEQQKLVTAIYVQDMGQADWNSPVGHWIDAKGAVYVQGSKRRGSMGKTLASFASRADADAFASQEGGTVYRFDQITPAMVDLDGGAIKDSKM